MLIHFCYWIIANSKCMFEGERGNKLIGKTINNNSIHYLSATVMTKGNRNLAKSYLAFLIAYLILFNRSQIKLCHSYHLLNAGLI